jgi:predicted transcriptional regulator YdeE
MSEVHHTEVSDPILIAGIQVRTTNVAELTGEGKIGPLWHRFFTENIADKIHGRMNNSLYVVYSNYESDEYGAYDYLIGAEVSSVDNLPEGLNFAAIVTGNYAVVTTEKGPVTQMVPGTWKEIWQMPHEELGGKRSFLSDYEVYGRHATDPTNAIVDIYVGIEPEAE